MVSRINTAPPFQRSRLRSETAAASIRDYWRAGMLVMYQNVTLGIPDVNNEICENNVAY